MPERIAMSHYRDQGERLQRKQGRSEGCFAPETHESASGGDQGAIEGLTGVASKREDTQWVQEVIFDF